MHNARDGRCGAPRSHRRLPQRVGGDGEHGSGSAMADVVTPGGRRGYAPLTPTYNPITFPLTPLPFTPPHHHRPYLPPTTPPPHPAACHAPTHPTLPQPNTTATYLTTLPADYLHRLTACALPTAVTRTDTHVQPRDTCGCAVVPCLNNRFSAANGGRQRHFMSAGWTLGGAWSWRPLQTFA